MMAFFTSSEVSRFKQAQVVRYYELMGEIEQKSLEASLAYIDVQLYRELLSLAEKKSNYACGRFQTN